MSESVLYHYKKIPKAGQLSKERRSFGSLFGLDVSKQFGDVKSKQCGKGSGEGLMADGGSTCDGSDHILKQETRERLGGARPSL